jgi:hypothetical protein
MEIMFTAVTPKIIDIEVKKDMIALIIFILSSSSSAYKL